MVMYAYAFVLIPVAVYFLRKGLKAKNATPEVRGSEGNLAQQDVAGVVMENQPLQDQSPVLDAAIGSGKKIKPTEMAPELMCNQPIDIQKNRFFEMDSSAPANQGTADIQEDQFSETDNPALTNQVGTVAVPEMEIQGIQLSKIDAAAAANQAPNVEIQEDQFFEMDNAFPINQAEIHDLANQVGTAAAAEPEGIHHSDSGENANIPYFVQDSSSEESSTYSLTGSPLEQPPRVGRDILSLQKQDNHADSNVLISQEQVATTLFTGEENLVSTGETMIRSPLHDVGLNQLLSEMPKHHSTPDDHQEGSDANPESPGPSPMQVEEDVFTDFPLKNANLVLSASESGNNDVSMSEKDKFLHEKSERPSSSNAILLPNVIFQQLGLSGDFMECKVHIHNKNKPLYLIARLHYGSRAIQVLKVMPAESVIAEQPSESHYPTIFLSRHCYKTSNKPKKHVSSSSNPLRVVPYTTSPSLKTVTVSLQSDETKEHSTTSDEVDYQAEEMPHELAPLVNSSFPSAGLFSWYFLCCPCCYLVVAFFRLLIQVMVLPLKRVFVSLWTLFAGTTARHVQTIPQPSTTDTKEQEVMENLRETAESQNLEFGSEQFNQPTLTKGDKNQDQENEANPAGDSAPHSVYSSAIFLFLFPCFLLLLAMFLFFFSRSRDLLRFIVWLLLKILLCPYKVLHSIWSYFCSLSRRNRRITGGTKPVSKKHDQNLMHDAPAEMATKMFADQCSTDRIEETLVEEKSTVGHGEKKGIFFAFQMMTKQAIGVIGYFKVVVSYATFPITSYLRCLFCRNHLSTGYTEPVVSKNHDENLTHSVTDEPLPPAMNEESDEPSKSARGYYTRFFFPHTWVYLLVTPLRLFFQVMAKPVIGVLVKAIWACVIFKFPYSIASHLFCRHRLATGEKHGQVLVHSVSAEMEAWPLADEPVTSNIDLEGSSERQTENQDTAGDRKKKGCIDMLLYPCSCFYIVATFFLKPVNSVQKVCASVVSRSDKLRGEILTEDTAPSFPAVTEPVSNEHDQTCMHNVSAEGAAIPLPCVNDKMSISKGSEYQSKLKSTSQCGGKKGFSTLIRACCHSVAILFGLVILKLVQGVFWCIKALRGSIASLLRKIMTGAMSSQSMDYEEEPVPMSETGEEGNEYQCQENKFFLPGFLLSCTCWWLVASFFKLFFDMMMKPVEALSNSIQAIWAHVTRRVLHSKAEEETVQYQEKKGFTVSFLLCTCLCLVTNFIHLFFFQLPVQLLSYIIQALWARMTSQSRKSKETTSSQIIEPSAIGSENHHLDQPKPNQDKSPAEYPSPSGCVQSRSSFLPLLCPCCYVMAVVLRYIYKMMCGMLFKQPSHQDYRQTSSSRTSQNLPGNY